MRWARTKTAPRERTNSRDLYVSTKYFTIMKKRTFYLASMAALLNLNAASAQEPVKEEAQEVAVEQTEEKKDGFFKRAFRDMKESARLQHKIDKANFEATKLENKAAFQEQKRKSNPKVRTAAERQRMENELQAAQERKEAAQRKLDSVRNAK